jgi:hypothetical protein
MDTVLAMGYKGFCGVNRMVQVRPGHYGFCIKHHQRYTSLGEKLTIGAKALPLVAQSVQRLSYGDWLVGLVALGFLAVKVTDGKLHHIPNPSFDKWYSYPQEGQLNKTTTKKRTRNINMKMVESVFPSRGCFDCRIKIWLFSGARNLALQKSSPSLLHEKLLRDITSKVWLPI